MILIYGKIFLITNVISVDSYNWTWYLLKLYISLNTELDIFYPTNPKTNYEDVVAFSYKQEDENSWDA